MTEQRTTDATASILVRIELLTRHLPQAMFEELANEVGALMAACTEVGRRQATEGWQREWGAQYRNDSWVQATFDDEGQAVAYAAEAIGHRAVSRLVGPWEPAEQPDPITPEVYGEFFPERDDAGEPLSAEPARGGTARGGTVTAVPDTHPGFAVLDPTAPLDHAVLDRLEVVSHNGVDDREGWSEITMRDRPEDGR